MTVITQLPTPPSRAVPNQFSTRGDEFLGALPAFVTETNAVAAEVNAVAAEVNADKTTAVNSAVTAATKAAEAAASAGVASIVGTSTKWVAGTAYTTGQGVWSPVDYLPYRRLTNGTGTTDPSADSINWKPLPPGPMVRVARTSDVEITPADRGRFFDITSGTFSQTFSSKAILGNGFYCYILNSRTGVVTIDPGGLDYALYNEQTVLVQCDGVSLRVVHKGPGFTQLPLFSSVSASATPFINGDVIASYVHPFAGTANWYACVAVITNGTTIVAYHKTSGVGNLAMSSVDGMTWVARSLPLTGEWGQGTSDGYGFILASRYSNLVHSPDGVTWTDRGPLPAGNPVEKTLCSRTKDEYIVRSNSTPTRLYKTIDNGLNWTAQAAPIETYNILSINGIYVVSGETAYYYTSTSGETGTWTERVLPGGHITMVKRLDGKLLSYGFNGQYTSVDGIDWVLENGHIPVAAELVNGVYITGGVDNSGVSTLKTYHADGLPAVRNAETVCSAESMLDPNMSCIFIGKIFNANGAWPLVSVFDINNVKCFFK